MVSIIYFIASLIENECGSVNRIVVVVVWILHLLGARHYVVSMDVDRRAWQTDRSTSLDPESPSSSERSSRRRPADASGWQPLVLCDASISAREGPT
jgi:3-mercaptopyruvate sulfurtransferase SseA